jgi:hypothetical protein
LLKDIREMLKGATDFHVFRLGVIKTERIGEKDSYGNDPCPLKIKITNPMT